VLLFTASTDLGYHIFVENQNASGTTLVNPAADLRNVMQQWA